MGNSVMWHLSDFAEWEDGERKMTGPGVVEFNDEGKVIAVHSLLPPEPKPELIQVHVAEVQVPEQPPDFSQELL